LHESELQIDDRLFPYLLRGKDLALEQVLVVVKPKEKGDYSHFDPEPPADPIHLQFGRTPLTESGAPPEGELEADTIAENPDWGGLPVARFPGISGSPFGGWGLRLDPAPLPAALRSDVDGRPRLNRDLVEDILLVLQYEVAV
jgi:hypothetical protein